MGQDRERRLETVSRIPSFSSSNRFLSYLEAERERLARLARSVRDRSERDLLLQQQRIVEDQLGRWRRDLAGPVSA